MEKEPRTIKELEVSVKWSDQWHKVSHIKPFTPVLIQHHQDEGTPESYETKVLQFVYLTEERPPV